VDGTIPTCRGKEKCWDFCTPALYLTLSVPAVTGEKVGLLSGGAPHPNRALDHTAEDLLWHSDVLLPERKESTPYLTTSSTSITSATG